MLTYLENIIYWLYRKPLANICGIWMVVPNTGILFGYADEGHRQIKALLILPLSLDFKQEIIKQNFRQEPFSLTESNFERAYCPVYHMCEMMNVSQKMPYIDIKYLFICGAMTNPAPSLCLIPSLGQDGVRQTWGRHSGWQLPTSINMNQLTSLINANTKCFLLFNPLILLLKKMFFSFFWYNRKLFLTPVMSLIFYRHFCFHILIIAIAGEVSILQKSSSTLKYLSLKKNPLVRRTTVPCIVKAKAEGYSGRHEKKQGQRRQE